MGVEGQDEHVCLAHCVLTEMERAMGPVVRVTLEVLVVLGAGVALEIDLHGWTNSYSFFVCS